MYTPSYILIGSSNLIHCLLASKTKIKSVKSGNNWALPLIGRYLSIPITFLASIVYPLCVFT